MLLITTWPSVCLADEWDPLKPDFSCLTRPQKNAIEVCFKENEQCHEDVQAKDTEVRDGWENVLGAGAVALVVGFLLAYETGVHK